MSIGFACITLGVPGTNLKSCLIKNADGSRLRELISHNLQALENMVDYNASNGIKLFRISSDIIPFASSPVNTVSWDSEYAERFAVIGQKIRAADMRVSMHPGQYTVLNSPSEQTAENAVKELAYHALFMDSLGMDRSHKIILHIGGVYGDKAEAVRLFSKRYLALDETVKKRLVIENDDKSYHAGDVLQIGQSLGIPVVFDNLHHDANTAPGGGSHRQWIQACAHTWQPCDGKQKIHYSQSDTDKKTGAHSLSIALDPFLAFYGELGRDRPDIMLEVKDKNISALKCILSTENEGNIGLLEREWARYKYLVLERSQDIYQRIRSLLKDKTAYPAQEFFRLTEQALAMPVDTGSAINAAAHIWGYFKDIASPAQKKTFLAGLDAFAAGKASLLSIKRKLYSLAETCGQDYLLGSYYFVEQYHAGKQPPLEDKP